MKTLNVLVVGHIPNLLQTDNEHLEKVFSSLSKAIDMFATFATTSGRKLRLIAGDAAGTDHWVHAIANERDLELIAAGVYRHPKDVQTEARTAKLGLWLSKGAQEAVSEFRRQAAIDEVKLFYADLLVVVWDGKPPEEAGVGSVRLLIEAINQRKPVLWIDAGSRSSGQLRWLDFSVLDASSITLLDADEDNVQRLGEHFFHDLPQDHNAMVVSISTPLETYLLPKSAEDFRRLWEKWDPHDESIKHGWIHSGFLRLFGYPRVEGGQYKSYPVAGFESPEDLQKSFWAYYHALDRAAVKASHVHRDQVVLTHLLAAFAVFFAVAGSIRLFGLDSAWGIAELIVLAAILLVVRHARKRGVSAHKAHLSLRHGAESFRVLSLLRPFLTCLPRIERSQWASTPTSANGFDLRTPQTWWVLRWFRDEGPPKGENRSGYTLANEIEKLKSSLLAFIEDQRIYHENAHHRWHKIHQRIELTMKLLFGLAIAAVLAHLFALGSHYAENHGWSLPNSLFNFGHGIHEYSAFLLIFTAFGPALAASLHGIAGKLELARLAVHSDTMRQQLSDLRAAAETIETTGEAAEASFMTLRTLSVQVANTIYAEHEAWVTLLHGQDLEIPA